VNERLLAELRRLPDAEERPSRWATAGPAFWIDGREFVHFHGDSVEVRLTRKLIAKLDDLRVAQRARSSDWVVVDGIETELVLELARDALEANRRS
jgi:Family of unknown function (DUF5519)